MEGTASRPEKELSRHERRQFRNRSIRKAVSTSLASKASTAILQFASLPVAARVLGREEFGIYATVSTAIFAVAMLQLGVGPALAKGISEAAAAGSRRREAGYYRNGAILLGSLILLGLGIVSLILTFVPITTLFGTHYAPWEPEMRSALWCGVLLMTGQLLVAHTDRVREGYMEAATVNTASTVGNLVGALVLAIGIFRYPSIEFLLCAIYLPNILTRIVNTAFLIRKRPYLITFSGRLETGVMRHLVQDGLSFTATSFLVFAVEYGLCALLVGRWLGPSDVAIFHVLMTVTTAFAGLLKMVGTPVWAALIDANNKADVEWVTKTIQRYRSYLFILTAVAGTSLIALGPLLLPLWYGEEFSAGRLLLIAHVIFLLTAGWRRVHRTLAIGLGKITATVAPITGGLALEIFFGIFGLHFLGLPGLFFGLCLGALLVPGWILPREIREAVRTLMESEFHPQSSEPRRSSLSCNPAPAESA